MTDRRMHELLTESVEDVPPLDVADAAWERSRAVRRRRWAAGSAVATATVVLGVLVAVEESDRVATPQPASPSMTMTERPSSPDAGTGPRFAVWVGPTKKQELALPRAGSLLPPLIDVRDARTSQADDPLERALVAVGVWNGADRHVVLVGADGELRRLDGLDLSSQGSGWWPVQAGSLSPDGTRLALAYRFEVVVHDLVTAEQSDYPVEYSTEGLRWLDDDAVLLEDGSYALSLTDSDVVPYEGDAEVDRDGRIPYQFVPTGIRNWEASGPVRSNDGQQAQMFYADGPVPKAEVGWAEPETIVVDGPRPAILVLDYGPPLTYNERWIQCCPVASWLDDNTVAFESNGVTQTVLSWDVRSGQVALVTEFLGGDVRSYADLTR